MNAVTSTFGAGRMKAGMQAGTSLYAGLDAKLAVPFEMLGEAA